MMRAGKNEKICGGRDDNVGKCHIIGQGGAFRSSLSVLTNALIITMVGTKLPISNTKTFGSERHTKTFQTPKTKTFWIQKTSSRQIQNSYLFPPFMRS